MNKYIKHKESFLKMYLYQNSQCSQNKHQVLNRIVKSIEKQVKYNEVDDYFWKLIKQQDKLLKIAYENNDLAEAKALKGKQLAKLQHFIKSHWHKRNFRLKSFTLLLSKILKANMVETIKPIRNEER